MSASKKIVGIICLVLTDDKNEHLTYNIPGCIYGPDPPINILEITAMGEFFNDSANVHSPLDDDGTTV